MTILPFQVPLFSSIPRRALSTLSGVLLLMGLGCAASPPAVPAPQPAPAGGVALLLKVGAPVERSLPLGSRDEIPLELKADQYVRLGLESQSLHLAVSLLSPGGEVLLKEDGMEEGRLAWLTATAGTYRLAISSPQARIAGRYKVLLQELRPVRPGDDRRVAADAALSAARQEKKDAAKALQQAQQALSLWSDLQDGDGEFEAFEEIAKHDEKNVVSWHGKALQRAQAAGNLRNQARAETRIGSALAGSNSFEEARLHLEKALPLWKDLGDSYQQSWVLYYLGFVSSRRGNLDEATDFYRRALESADPQVDLTPDIWNALGNTYAARGEGEQALLALERAIQLADALDLPGTKAAVLTSRGALYRRRGEPQKALASFQEAEKIDRSDPELDRDYTPKVLINLGAVFMDLGQPDAALEIYQQALEKAQSKDTDSIANILSQIGQVDLATGQLPEALKNFQQALALAPEAENPKARGAALHYIGVVQLRMGQLPAAVRSLQEALPLRKKTDRLNGALTQQKLGEAYRAQGDLASAGSSLREALEITRKTGDSYFQAPIYFDLAKLERQQGRPHEALTAIEQSIGILESVRYDLTDDRLRTSFLASRRSYYDFYIDLLMELDRREPGQGYADQALAKSEMGRARALLDLLTEARFELTRGISLELREKEKDVRARLSQIQRRIEEELSKESSPSPVVPELEARRQETEREQQEVEQRIKAESPLYAQVRYPSPLQREEIQKLLRPDEALLEYSLGEERAYLFVVTTEGLTSYPLKTAPAAIEDDIRTVRDVMEKRDGLPFAYFRAAHRLYEELVAPAREAIRGKRRLLIAPDGVLYRLNFEALLTREAHREADCRFLVEDWTVSTEPSASVLSSLSQQRPAAEGNESPKRLLAFAPDYGSAGAGDPARSAGSGIRPDAAQAPLPALEGAKREVAAIAGLYPQDQVKVYIGAEASRRSIQQNRLMGTARWIHFAGHARLDEEHPEKSCLVLTDGPLQVQDIFNLELNADLVVLSACRTAGKVVTGEGLVGLTRAFLYAGSPSVVVTLWQVADSSAGDLMLRFYENLDRNGDKAEALRQAKLARIAEGRQTGGRLARPYYWAPFILVGKPR